MLQKVMDLFSLELFGMYLVVTDIFTIIMVKLYLTTLRRISEGKSYRIFVVFGLIMYSVVIGFLVYTLLIYGFVSTTVTSMVMYIILYYPMKKFTNWIEQKGTEIALS